MSKPTIIMIVHAASDDGIHRLNESLLDRLGIYGRLTRVDQVAPEWDVATAVHMGSFNHLDEPLFIRLVQEAGWKQLDRLQLFIEREDDSAFSEYDLFDEIVPKEIANQAVGRGLGLPAPQQQLAFFERLRSILRHSLNDWDIEPVDTSSPWLFEVMTIYPSYFFECDARLVPYDKSTALSTDANIVSPVALAFDGVGVRWGSRRTDVLDSTTEEVKQFIHTLNPGDQVEIEGMLRHGPHGIAELQQVRSIAQRIA